MPRPANQSRYWYAGYDWRINLDDHRTIMQAEEAAGIEFLSIEWDQFQKGVEFACTDEADERA